MITIKKKKSHERSKKDFSAIPLLLFSLSLLRADIILGLWASLEGKCLGRSVGTS